MKNKTKQRKRYNKGTRQDYTYGGRVGYQDGGERATGRDDEMNAQQENGSDATPTPTPTPTETTGQTDDVLSLIHI